MPGNAGAGLRLYDLRKDPGEELDVSEQHPVRVAELRAYLERILATEREPSKKGPRRPDELKMLRSLGYVTLDSLSQTHSQR